MKQRSSAKRAPTGRAPARRSRWWPRLGRGHLTAAAGVVLATAAAGAQVGTAPVGTPNLSTAAAQTASTDSGEPADESPHICASRDPHAGIYHPKRLVVVNPCETVTGTVVTLKAEGDGDYHIRLALDPPYHMLINDANVKSQDGDLVLEIPCTNPVTQADAQAVCAVIDPALKVPAPKAGQHITVTGPYVNDTQHGWMEIHPIYSWQEIP